jgi:hypothetical protein
VNQHVLSEKDSRNVTAFSQVGPLLRSRLSPLEILVSSSSSSSSLLPVFHHMPILSQDDKTLRRRSDWAAGSQNHGFDLGRW